MILNGSFYHFKNIGETKLQKMKERGILTWEDARRCPEEIPLSPHKREEFFLEMDEVESACLESDFAYLVNRIHPKDKWRILADEFDRASFFDIETDGYYNRITTISLYHKSRLYSFTRNENLEDFLDVLEDVKLLVSFNGASFDLPVVVQNYRLRDFPAPHLDLRWISYHSGFRGGLKSIEKQLRIKRPADLEGVDGLEAISLWIRWIEWKDSESLAKLIRYCSADVISLVVLSERLINRQIKSHIQIDEEELWSLVL